MEVHVCKAAPRPPVSRYWLAILCLVSLALGAAQDSSRYLRTVHGLITADSPAQSVFALVALAELAQVYMAEADLARQESIEAQAGKAKLRGWSVAVDQYADQLLALHEGISAGVPASLSIGTDQVVIVEVDERRVMLNHPRIGQQAAFEQRLLADFCARQSCNELRAAQGAQTPIPVTASTVSPVWLFSGDGPVCQHQGISVQFSGEGELAWNKSICKQLLQEAQNLAVEIAWQRLQGVRIDWARLAVQTTDQRPGHIVSLNAAGDSALVSLPLIHGSKGLLRDLTPWLRAVSSREGQPGVSLQASRYGWEGQAP
jgi:hypothetical protein